MLQSLLTGAARCCCDVVDSTAASATVTIHPLPLLRCLSALLVMICSPMIHPRDVNEPCRKDSVYTCAKEPTGDHGVRGDALPDANAEQRLSTSKGNEKSRENADMESNTASVQDHKRSWRDVVTQGGKRKT